MISIVIPVHNEQESLRLLHGEITATAERAGLTVEVLFVDDGSGDGSWDVIADLAYPLPVTVICEMLGVPLDDHEAIRGWSSDIIRSLDAIGLLQMAISFAVGILSALVGLVFFGGFMAANMAAPAASGDVMSASMLIMLVLTAATNAVEARVLRWRPKAAAEQFPQS